MFFLRKEINNHNQLNSSRQIILIKNVLDIQLLLFCDTELNKDHSALELLQEIEKIVSELPLISSNKKWKILLNYLFFEYYFKTGQLKLAREYFELVESNKENLLLYTGLCCTHHFFVSKITFLQTINEVVELVNEIKTNINYDNADFFSKTTIELYKTIALYYNKNISQAIFTLNNVYENHSFKDYLHVQIEIKLLSAFLNIQNKNKKEGDLILTNIKRKIKAHLLENEYQHVFHLIKALQTGDYKNNIKTRYALDLFIAQNSSPYKIATYLMPIFKTI